MNAILMLKIFLTFGSSVLASDNIALRKPAYQSSVITAGYSTAPGNAVDGRNSLNMNYGQCTGTNYGDLTPWWMVDLGTAFKIHNITIAIRSDTKKKNLYDFYIEMFLVNPLTWGFITPQQCLFYNGTFPHSKKKTLTCDVPVTGRFVRIRKIPIPDNVSLRPMFLCEVEIRGTDTQINERPLSIPEVVDIQKVLSLAANKGDISSYNFLPLGRSDGTPGFWRNRTEANWECRPNNVPVFGGKMLLTESQQVVASDCLPDCLSRCYFNVDCKGINYNSLTQSCEVILARSENDTLVDDLEWRFVSLPYTTCDYQW